MSLPGQLVRHPKYRAMITAFDVIRLLAIFCGACLGGAVGRNTFGTFGSMVGIVLGMMIGGIAGRAPIILSLKMLSQRYDRMSDDDLLAELHDDNCMTPNTLLLELRRRGYDISNEIPLLHSLLTSDNLDRRTKGWAALASAFPHLLEQIPEYDPNGTTAECVASSQGLNNRDITK